MPSPALRLQPLALYVHKRSNLGLRLASCCDIEASWPLCAPNGSVQFAGWTSLSTAPFTVAVLSHNRKRIQESRQQASLIGQAIKLILRLTTCIKLILTTKIIFPGSSYWERCCSSVDLPSYRCHCLDYNTYIGPLKCCYRIKKKHHQKQFVLQNEWLSGCQTCGLILSLVCTIVPKTLELLESQNYCGIFHKLFIMSRTIQKFSFNIKTNCNLIPAGRV